MRDLANELHFVRAISPAAAGVDNTPFVSSIVDKAGYESLVFAILLGAIADADATFAVTLDHGDDPALADAAPVPAANLTGTLALASFDFNADNKLRKIGYTGSKRFTRLTITPANNAGNAFVAAIAILSDGRFIPTPNPPS